MKRHGWWIGDNSELQMRKSNWVLDFQGLNIGDTLPGGWKGCSLPKGARKVLEISVLALVG